MEIHVHSVAHRHPLGWIFVKQQQWASFVESIGAKLPPVAEIIEDVAVFLMPRVVEARGRENVSD
jgi:hypothetical protein